MKTENEGESWEVFELIGTKPRNDGKGEVKVWRLHLNRVQFGSHSSAL